MITLLAFMSLTVSVPDASTSGTEHLLAAGRPAAGCRADLEKIKDARHVGFTRLGALPDAHSEIAVNRMVGGCPAPLIVRYDVSR